tara:strand:+ start:5524 stop:5823 length:300 start_codon:yes stop_codon:yes gene_type:complete
VKLTINSDQLHFCAMKANATSHADRRHRSGFEVGLDSVRALANFAGQVSWDEMVPKKNHICPPADGAKRRFGLQHANSNVLVHTALIGKVDAVRGDLQS